MNGLSKIVVALLLSLPLVVSAQEKEVEAVIASPVEEVVKSDTVAPEAVELTAEPAPVEAPVEALPTSKVDTLLEKAKQENSKRTSMRRAGLSETECLATAMYHEARGEGDKGMMAVAFVIHNRMSSNRFPKNACEVVLQRSQFSFTSDRNPDNIKEWAIYAKVLAMAVELMENNGFQRITSPVGGALFFNSLRGGGWSYAKARRFIATIGNHHFFK